MVRVGIFGKAHLFGRSDVTASFIPLGFYGGLAVFSFLTVTVLIFTAKRGRGRSHSQGCSRDVTERHNYISSPGSPRNGDREEMNLGIDSSDEDSGSRAITTANSCVNRKPRSYCQGQYGRPPPPDKIPTVAVGQGHIMDPVATRTMSSIIRQHWPAGCFTYRDAVLETHGKFKETILNEFHRYYKYEDGVNESQGDRDVLLHVQNRMRGLKSEEKKRAFRRAAKNGKPLIDQKPKYFSKEAWISLCSHFLGAEHAAKSEISKRNRMKKVMVHVTGSTSHAKIKKDLTEKIKRPPTRLELFESTYKSKSTQTYTSKEARTIAERYKLILEERQQTLNESADEPIEWWIEATGPVKKNRIVGEPRISANDLLTGSHAEYHNSKLPNQSTCGRCLSDDLFFNIVKETLRTASSSTLFKEGSVSQEQVQSLAEGVVLSGAMSNSDNAIEKEEKKEEIIRLVITTIEGIYSRIHHSLKEQQNVDQANKANGVTDGEATTD